MSSIQDLREHRVALRDDLRKLLEDYPAGSKWGSEQESAFTAKEGDLTAVESQITAFERLMAHEAEAKVVGSVADSIARRAHDRDPNDPLRIYDTWIRQGEKAVTAEQWKIVRNTMSTTTGSEGGFTVPSLIAQQLIDAMKAYGVMRAVAEVFTTATGAPLSYPTSDGTAEVGEIVPQNSPATNLDPVFGTVSLNVFKFGSKVVAIPIELLQDSLIDMDAFIRNRLAQRLGRIQNIKFTVGAGTTEPDGIVPRATAGKVGTTGQTLTIIYDDLVDLVHSVDPAYRSIGASFMTSDSSLKVMRKIKDTGGRPLWTPSYDQGISTKPSSNQLAGGYTGQNVPVVFDYLLGYPVYVNNDMPPPAANAKSVLFGVLSYYKIRDAMEMTMFRFTDSAYSKLGQVGFLAWLRAGGNLVDPNAVKYYQNSAT
jgi:HK97 family phage major capsid protein